MSNGFAEAGAAGMTHGKLGNFIIKIDETLDNYLAGTGAPTFLGVVPCLVDIALTFDRALSLARGTHNRLYHTGYADIAQRLVEFFATGCKAVRRCPDAELFSGQASYAFTVHGELCGTGSGYYGVTFAFQLDQCIGGDGLDFRHDIVWFFSRYDLAQGVTIEHGDSMTAVCDLHRRSIFVAVDHDNLNAKPLQFDNDFLAEFTATTKQHAGCRRG